MSVPRTTSGAASLVSRIRPLFARSRLDFTWGATALVQQPWTSLRSSGYSGAVPSRPLCQRGCFSTTTSEKVQNKSNNEEDTKTTTETPIVIKFVDKDGIVQLVKAYEGENLLDVAHSAGVRLEGACGGGLACSTCHVILEDNVFDALPSPTEREDDLLDLAPCLTETSRLGCQIHLSKYQLPILNLSASEMRELKLEGSPEIHGLIVKLPKSTVNFYMDGYVPEPH